MAAYLGEVRQKADDAYQVMQGANLGAAAVGRREAEARQEADDARHRHDEAAFEARLAKTAAEDSNAQLVQVRARRRTLRLWTWLTAGLLLLAAGGYFLAAWQDVVPRLAEPVVEALVGLGPAALAVLLGGVAAVSFRKRLARAEGRAARAAAAYRDALAAVELAKGAAVRTADRAAEVEHAAAVERQVTSQRAEELRQLMSLNDDSFSGPSGFAAPVVRECGRILQEAFTRYLDSDCGVEKELSDQLVRELSRQVQAVGESEMLSEDVNFSTRLRTSVAEVLELREEVFTTLDDLTKKANAALLLEGDKAPAAVFAEIQEEVIQPSLQLVMTSRDEWQKLKDDLAALAQQHAPAEGRA
jgi:hypothetical protein